MDISIIWAVIAFMMYVLYNLYVLDFATEILVDASKNLVVHLACVLVNFLSVFIIGSADGIPFATTYFIGFIILTAEFKLISKSSWGQVLFGGSVFFFHISSMHLIVIMVVNTIRNMPPLIAHNTPTLYYQEFFITFLLLWLVLITFKRFLPIETIVRVSVAKGYSPIVLATVLMLLSYNVALNIVVVTNEIELWQLLITLLATVSNLLIFYFVFLYTSKIVNMHVFKRKNDEIHDSYKALENEKNQIEDKIFKDSLTQSYNRKFIFNTLDELCRMVRIKFGVVFVDINGLKYVNDNYGHEKGDSYIKDIVNAISSAVREGDLIGRIGGDEFVVILKNLDNEQDVDVVVNRMKLNISNYKNALEHIFSASFGYAYVDTHFQQTCRSEILQETDNIMRSNKEKFYRDLETK